MNDKKEKELPQYGITGEILGCCFEVMKELGPGFQERIYKNALLIVMREKGLQVDVEQSFEVIFRDTVIGRYKADLVVEKTIIVELKCCECLIREHQAQLFNYLKVSKCAVGLLVNFQHRKLEYKRLHRGAEIENDERMLEEILPV